ncbi:MAG: hypothetical protein HFG79_07160 [Lachnospiraceae bacterium]|nr:hypothetical protein [Lachnospiraceae bacterium]
MKGSWGSKKILGVIPFTQPVCAAGANWGGLAAPGSSRSMTTSLKVNFQILIGMPALAGKEV